MTSPQAARLAVQSVVSVKIENRVINQTFDDPFLSFRITEIEIQRADGSEVVIELFSDRDTVLIEDAGNVSRS